MAFIDAIKGALPDYAKDTKLNLDAVLLRSTLDADVAMGCAVAALAATGNGKVLAVLLADAPVHADAAMTAASIMAQNNVWYPYVEMADDPSLKGLPAQLRMNAIASHGGTTKAKFEAYFDKGFNTARSLAKHFNIPTTSGHYIIKEIKHKIRQIQYSYEAKDN